MRIALTVFAILLLAGTAMAADMAKGPEVVESIPQIYTDQYLSRADVLDINVLEGVFTDLSAAYVAAFTANGLATDVIYDPMGAFDPSTYQMVVYNSSEDWWTSYTGYSADLGILSTYIDGGGCVMAVGQDMLWGGGAPVASFVTTYCGVLDYIEDVNGGDTSLSWTGTAGGFIDGLSGSQVSTCWTASPNYYTDDLYFVAQGVVTFTSDTYGPAEGGSQDVAIFSTVEFGCEGAASLSDIIGRFVVFCGGVVPTPTNNTTWGQIKIQ
ncbi:MAG: hypothetical protein KJ970_05095 [Candidatus Eisenbacteria bacterium]|jgi:hypothetical protein|uniref:Uncharacterized protein n=1 Tax=Eiseniibacteriota bacterium TaxID=2212470 RepID=A0A948RSX4_UNCEI|nr:hypothetical protein [Candidatus Eisenbacteria bacterium]MBU1947583.1 hypothetical protein [Candidatus Eisenbacteria bacterium]MBU2690285.1 hypothetical protein [Candidatus Eisenbacteria bacterium]